ncbi:Uncharacterized conserved protein, DUF58 family, contains vWF domain [Myxococcus fulvus]|uniref:Uncharacterized conserved protein, DUF58 family, contains vWF domain n=1 Tax=Myxococcus fulvus TaxID=33 RepID=A0A511TDZ2_MYXFU|nr:DUF58 domain-containing protein [Myxococcus fulvus]GEN12386.1 hypothetical protein MFU01_74230 [Myxococcus fulvus]SET75304.1 Uncharacterized conserved protein, DUF58 family, contains vWF domain [Myxococcus fulvus]
MKSTWKQRWARLRARLRPPRTLRVTRIGRTYLVVTFGVGLGALNTGNNLLYLLLGLLLSMVVVSGVLSERCIRDLSVRRVGTDAAFAGEPFAFRWAVSRKQGQAFALVLAEADSPLTGAGGVGYLPSGVEHIVRADLVAPRRGPVRLTGVQVTTTWPLGLFAKTRVLSLEGLLLVYPKRGYACMDPGDAERGPVGDAGNPRRNDGSGDVTGLRELAEGEDARRIHWLKSASMGKLLRVEREREERRTWMLSIEPGLEGDALERRCEEVAALAHRLLEEGHEVGLHTAEERLRAGTGAAQERRILRALAWLGFERPRDEEAAA